MKVGYFEFLKRHLHHVVRLNFSDVGMGADHARICVWCETCKIVLGTLAADKPNEG